MSTPSASGRLAAGPECITSECVPVDLDRLADLIAERLTARLPGLQASAPAGRRAQPLTVRQLAEHLGASAAYVYEHAAELGGWRLPSGGPRPRWRFDVEAARSAHARLTSEQSVAGGPPDHAGDSDPARRRPVRRLPNPLPKPGGVLAVRPDDGQVDDASQ